MLDRTAKLRLTLIIFLGLGASYGLAVHRKLIPSIGTLIALQSKHTRAKQTGEIPWNSTIGGEAGIHGVPKLGEWLIDDRNNWTWGCLSLKTKDIDELYDVVNIGTIVEIVA